MSVRLVGAGRGAECSRSALRRSWAIARYRASRRLFPTLESRLWHRSRRLTSSWTTTTHCADCAQFR